MWRSDVGEDLLGEVYSRSTHINISTMMDVGKIEKHFLRNIYTRYVIAKE
jgi:hypothetical protein